MHGYLTLNISGSSDVTLTTGNGVPDQARNAMIELVGTITTNINLIVPTVTHQYTIIANHVGGNVTVKTSSGSGIIFTPRKEIYCSL